MKKTIFMAVLIACAAAATATAQVVEERFPCYVEISGYAERDVTPDTFYLSITIAEKDSKGKISVESQQRDMMKALKSMGVDTEKQLTMVDMTGAYFKKNNTLLTAQYRLKLTSAADVRKAYSLLGDIGISAISMRSVSYSKIAEVRNEVRAESIKNARDKAAMLAQAIGQNIGNCIRITDYSRDAGEETVAYATRSVKLMANADTIGIEEPEPMEFKPIKVVSSLNARFTLLDAKGKPISEWPTK